jgi:hypothetical protein
LKQIRRWCPDDESNKQLWNVGLHCDISQKVVTFILAAVRTWYHH